MRVIFSLILLSLFLCSETINEQIHALEDATPKERVELMNSIKEQLVSMNEEKRMQSIEMLREKLQDKSEIQHNVSEVNNEQKEHIETAEEHEAHEEMVHHDEATHIHNESHQHEHNHEELLSESTQIEEMHQDEASSGETNHKNGIK